MGPFDFIHEIREMNQSLTERLDRIIAQLETLIVLERADLYGDGR